jgi:hypothetical protein
MQMMSWCSSTPTKQDNTMTKHILQLFGEATGLIANMNKTEIYPIGCQDINLMKTLEIDLQLSDFPIRT